MSNNIFSQSSCIAEKEKEIQELITELNKATSQTDTISIIEQLQTKSKELLADAGCLVYFCTTMLDAMKAVNNGKKKIESIIDHITDSAVYFMIHKPCFEERGLKQNGLFYSPLERMHKMRYLTEKIIEEDII